MNTKELKSLYYSKLAVDPDYPAWEEFEYQNALNGNWFRFSEPINHNTWRSPTIRHNPKPKQWSPPIGNVFIEVRWNEVCETAPYTKKEIQQWASNGVVRSSKEQAEQDLKQIRQFCRFLAWRAENCCYSDGIVPALDYAGLFLKSDSYYKLARLINDSEVEL